MANTTASAECNTMDVEVVSKKEPIQLCMFVVKRTTPEFLARTAEYAANPTKYLRHVLGQDTYEKRKRQNLLCLPDKIEQDFYGTGVTKHFFETHVARLMGKTQGLFFITGVQAQLAALKIYCQAAQNPKVAWHLSSHLESAEESAFKELYRLERIPLGNDVNSLPSVREIQDVLAQPPHHRPAAILVEIPNRVLGCETYTFEELQTISRSCAEAGVKFHCDGARLWEIEPYYQETAGRSFADVCGLFDSVYLSFYKGLGGVTGAMLISNDAQFISDAKVWQRRAGGNAFQLTYEVVDCMRGFNETIGTFAQKRLKMTEVAKAITDATESRFKVPIGSGWSGEHQPVISFKPSVPKCCQVHTIFTGYTSAQLEAARDRVQEKTNIRVFERLKPKQTLDEKMKKERLASANRAQRAYSNGASKDTQEGLTNGTVTNLEEHDKVHFMEWMIMDVTVKLDTQVFVDGYVALCEELAKLD